MIVRKYPKYSSGPDYGGSGATNSVAGVANITSNAVQKSRSYSNFDSLKRTDFSNLNTLGQVRVRALCIVNLPLVTEAQ